MESRSGGKTRGWKVWRWKWENEDWWGPELYLFSVTVGGPRAMGGPPQGGPVVVKVSSGIHLMLWEPTTSELMSNGSTSASESAK